MNNYEKALENVLESYLIDDIAEEGLFDKLRERKANKVAIGRMKAVISTSNPKAITKKFIEATADKYNWVNGPEGDSAVKTEVGNMIGDDAKSGKNYEGKISAKDFEYIKIKGISAAYLPQYEDGKGIGMIIVPSRTKDGGVTVTYVHHNHIAKLLVEAGV